MAPAVVPVAAAVAMAGGGMGNAAFVARVWWSSLQLLLDQWVVPRGRLSGAVIPGKSPNHRTATSSIMQVLIESSSLTFAPVNLRCTNWHTSTVMVQFIS